MMASGSLFRVHEICPQNHTMYARLRTTDSTIASCRGALLSKEQRQLAPRTHD